MTTTTMASVCVSVYNVRAWATTAPICDKYYAFTFARTHIESVALNWNYFCRLCSILIHWDTCVRSKRKWNGIRAQPFLHPISVVPHFTSPHWFWDIGMSVCHTRERERSSRCVISVHQPLCTKVSGCVLCVCRPQCVCAEFMLSHLNSFGVSRAVQAHNRKRNHVTNIFFLQRQSNRNGDDDHDHDHERQIIIWRRRRKEREKNETNHIHRGERRQTCETFRVSGIARTFIYIRTLFWIWHQHSAEASEQPSGKRFPRRCNAVWNYTFFMAIEALSTNK